MFRSTTKSVTYRLAVGMFLIPLLQGEAVAQAGQNPRLGTITGRVTVLDKGDKQADDVSQTVVWIETVVPVAMPVETVTVNTSKKEFQPHLVVLPVGSSVTFPNTDAFDHNVFSLTDNALFDLGSFGRGEARGTTFTRPGIVRIYCNVHPNMSSVVVVRDNPYYALPSADGSFTISDVPVGTYVLHAWHERANNPVSQQVEVTGNVSGELALQLDAREYEFVQHLNKFGRPYSMARRGRRY